MGRPGWPASGHQGRGRGGLKQRFAPGSPERPQTRAGPGDPAWRPMEFPMQSFACARCGAVITSGCRCPVGHQADGRWAFAEQVIPLGRILHPRQADGGLEDPDQVAPRRVGSAAGGRRGAAMRRIVGHEADRPGPIAHGQTPPPPRRATGAVSRMAVVVGLGLVVAAGAVVLARSPT
jgi:hypothetical protein